MEVLAIIIVVVYALALLFIFSYSIVQLSLVINYLSSKVSKKNNVIDKSPVLSFLPKVTIQLPIYNELYVVERLLDAVAKIDYPKDRLQIQVLDDSTDETADIIRKKVFDLQSQGCDIAHIQREIRKGFKAGALAEGLESATGEFIAIFDADFIPRPAFFHDTLPAFTSENTGMVQTRWQHLNKDHSLLTRLQAFGLDAHFTVEQTGRNAAGHFINFNGTSGIWRKKCIEDAGGWQSDTLTEDLDLSYRAQLRGWKFIYKEDTGTPAELPVDMNTLKNQQFRWNKGAAECVRKNLGSVLRKRGYSFSNKVHAVFHLMNSTVFIFILITAVLSIPLLFIKSYFPQWSKIFLYASFFQVSVAFLGCFYFVAQAQGRQGLLQSFRKFLYIFPVFLSVSMGLALHNTVAVLQGYFGIKTNFKRTPKFNLQEGHSGWKQNRYLEKAVNWMVWSEALCAVYFTFGIVSAFFLKDYGLLPFHLLLAFGFGFVSYFSFAHSKQVTAKSYRLKWRFKMVRS